MDIKNNISLKPYNTFGIDVKAKHFVSVKTIDELKTIYQSEQFPNKLILGGGSNILLTKDVDALVIHLNLKGKTIVKQDNNEVFIKCQTGENWHEFVL